MAKPAIIVYDNNTREDLNDLNDVVVTTPADNELLAYDTASGTWINQTSAEAGISTSSDLTTHEADTSTHGVGEVADASDLTTHESDTSTHGVSEVADAADLANYLPLTGGTLTGNTGITKADPELRLTDSGDSEYTRITRSDTSKKATRYNRVTKPGAPLPALSFDGGDYASGGATGFTLGTFTAEFWVKPTNGITTGTQMMFTPVSNDGWRVGGGWTSGKFGFFCNTAGEGWQRADSTTSVVGGTWYHVACTYDKNAGANNIKIWIDGVNEASVTGTGDVSPTGIFAIGAYPGVGEYFTGIIDEVRFSDNVRYTTTFTPPTEPFTTDGNTLGLWHLDENTGTNAADSSGNSKDMTLAAPTATPTWADGNYTADSATTEVMIWSSENGVGDGEEGIQKFGDDDGKTVLQGENIYIGTGTGKQVGFFNETPVGQQAYTAVSDPPTQAQVTSIRDALINLGLMASS